MRTFVTIYRDRKYLVDASSSYEAQCLAAKFFNVKPKYQYQISVFLSDVPISTSSI